MLLKYGLWAVVIISDFWLRGGNPVFVQVVLWLSHWGMAFEGFIFLRHIKISWKEFTIIFLWLIFNDFADYYLGLHPYLYAPEQFSVALWSALLLTIFLALGSYPKRIA